MNIERKKYSNSEYMISDQWDILSPRFKAKLLSTEWEMSNNIMHNFMYWWHIDNDLINLLKQYILRPKIKKNGKPSVKISTIGLIDSKPKQIEIYVPHAVAKLFADRVQSIYNGLGDKVLSTKSGNRDDLRPENLIRTNKNHERSYIFGAYILSETDITNLKSLYNKSNNLEQTLKQSWIRDQIATKWKIQDSYLNRIQTLISN